MSTQSIFRVVAASELDATRDVFVCVCNDDNTKGNAGRTTYGVRFPVRSSCTMGADDRRIRVQLVPGMTHVIQKEGARELKRLLLQPASCLMWPTKSGFTTTHVGQGAGASSRTRTSTRCLCVTRPHCNKSHWGLWATRTSNMRARV
jgi:hypothetical protein